MAGTYADGYVRVPVAIGRRLLKSLTGWYCVSIINRAMISANIIKHRCGWFTEKKEGENKEPKCGSDSWFRGCGHSRCEICIEEMKKKYDTKGQSAGPSHPQPAEDPPPYEGYVISFSSEAWANANQVINWYMLARVRLGAWQMDSKVTAKLDDCTTSRHLNLGITRIHKGPLMAGSIFVREGQLLGCHKGQRTGNQDSKAGIREAQTDIESKGTIATR